MVYFLAYSTVYTILPKRQSNWSQPPVADPCHPHPWPLGRNTVSASQLLQRSLWSQNLLNCPGRSSNSSSCLFNWNICLWISELIYFDPNLVFWPWFSSFQICALSSLEVLGTSSSYKWCYCKPWAVVSTILLPPQKCYLKVIFPPHQLEGKSFLYSYLC